jgi:Zn-dependent protease with chaperone function
MTIVQACYDIREGSVFWLRMELNEDASELKGEERDSIPEFFTTHPSHKKRVQFFDHLIPQV